LPGEGGACNNLFMLTVTLKAHYDGRQIVLDEPFDLLPNATLIVTVLPPAAVGEVEHAQWGALSARGLAHAYSDSEPEYTEADIKQA
jgi:hypothetical protein